MTKKEFVVGMDGGATKTAAMLTDLKGIVLAEETGGASNPQVVSPEKTAVVIVDLLERLAEKAGCKTTDIVSTVAGLAGAGREGDKERVRNAVAAEARKRRLTIGRVGVDSDGRIALEGAFKGKAGIILIAGTGSFALAKDHKEGIHRAGGWGRIAGDEGSGQILGREGLSAVARHFDGRGKSTALTKLVAERFDLSTQERIISAVYRENFDVATIAPLVIEAATAHDIECSRILNKATFELAEHVRVLVQKIEESAHARSKIPLALIGSLIANDNVYQKILVHKITFSMPQVKVVHPEAPPAYGAVLLSIRSAQDLA
jgi:N-acetylglucosamine kinase-like BadF-type ATPase